MSLPENRASSPYEAYKESRRHYNIMWTSDVKEPEKTYDDHCPIHHARWIPWTSPDDLHCPICGMPKPKPIPVESNEDNNSKKKKQPSDKKSFAISASGRTKKSNIPDDLQEFVSTTGATIVDDVDISSNS